MNAVSAGGCGEWNVIFTINLAEQKRTLLVDQVDLLRNVMREVKSKHPSEVNKSINAWRGTGYPLPSQRFKGGCKMKCWSAGNIGIYATVTQSSSLRAISEARPPPLATS